MPQHATPGSLLGKIAAYTELLAKDPYSTIFVPLSEAYRQMDMLDEAVEVAQKGIMDNPAFAGGYVALGSAYAAQGMEDLAIAEFEKALILENRHLPALKELAKIKMSRADTVGARELLERARAVKGNDPEVLKLFAALASSPAAAVAVVPTATRAQAAATSAAAGTFVADESGEAAAEVSVAGKAVEPIATATLAEIYIRQGLPQKALKVYRDLLKADPHNEQLRNKLIQLKQQLDTQELPALDEKTILAPALADITTPVEDLSPQVSVTVAETPVGLASAHTPDFPSFPQETLDLTVPVEAFAGADTVAADLRIERSVPEVLSAWLDAIRKRRAIHV
ncbi:tetratricopeptide repeat protein [Trichloromonas sp.]|uniref:tetratricopeptide repeat protein n=1 Tax=Trichloromonas sp. TaxID=3069249 RepID=UPI002A4A89AB|nr:tetratricopeptide repeat protein [Trichloromonas sp.]